MLPFQLIGSIVFACYFNGFLNFAVFMVLSISPSIKLLFLFCYVLNGKVLS